MTFSPLRFVDKDKDKALFFATLRKRVDGYFRENNISRNYNSSMVIKTVVLLCAYILPFLAILIFNPSFKVACVLWVITGLGLAGIGMSIMHDANHGAYSSSTKVNYWLGHTLNLLGGSVFNWKLQHNVLHHTYTNILNYDDDIADKVILKFTPHNKAKWYHKFQPVYAIFFYGITTLYWGLLKDFMQFSRYTKQGINTMSKEQNRTIFLKLLISKIAYVFVFIILPIFILKMAVGPYVLGFLLMHFVAGFMLTLIFQLAHTVEGTTYPLPNENYTIENNWAIHQMNTTVNFSRHNKFISWYVGGLNFQVEHHLFPNICHVHYPEISEIVKATAEEFGVPYLENKTFLDAVKSHFKALVNFGKLPDLNEAIG